MDNGVTSLDIARIMLENGITIKDVEMAVKDLKEKRVAGETFDLLIETFGEKVRVSFNDGKNQSPVAIFPFKDKDVYISLDETGEVEYPSFKKQAQLPLLEMVKELVESGVVKALNERLSQLGKPILFGSYWVKGFDHFGHQVSYCIADVHGEKVEPINGDLYSKAKFRCFDKF